MVEYSLVDCHRIGKELEVSSRVNSCRVRFVFFCFCVIFFVWPIQRFFVVLRRATKEPSLYVVFGIVVMSFVYMEVGGGGECRGEICDHWSASMELAILLHI